MSTGGLERIGCDVIDRHSLLSVARIGEECEIFLRNRRLWALPRADRNARFRAILVHEPMLPRLR